MEHAAHWESPAVGAMEPAEQEVQVLMTVAPEAAENLPAEHDRQEALDETPTAAE